MKKKQKGFTLVELLVVIAILAVLATVSILGYSSFTRKATISNDEAIVSQMNLILQAYESDSQEKAKNMHEAVEQVLNNGFIYEKLTPTTTGYHIVYDVYNNRFALLKENFEVQFKDVLSENNYDIFVMVKTKADYEEAQEKGYSIYLDEEFDTNDHTLKTIAGYDAGNNSNIKTFTYEHTTGTAQNVVIRTNIFGSKVIVNGLVDATDNTKGDVVMHYGYAGLVEIIKVAMASYDEYGYIGKIIATATNAIGHIDIKEGAIVHQVEQIGGSNTKVSISEEATVYDSNNEKIEGAISEDSTHFTASNNEVVVASECTHEETNEVFDGINTFEVCKKCGYTVIRVKKGDEITKKTVTDTIIPMATYGSSQISEEGNEIALSDIHGTGDEEGKSGLDVTPDVEETPVVDPEQPVDPTCNHSWNVVVENATCTANGSKVSTCTKCGTQTKITLKAKGHKWVDDDHCSNCKMDLDDYVLAQNSKYVARIGVTGYISVEKAIDSITNNTSSIICILTNIDLGTPTNNSVYVIPTNRNIKLNLNGYTIVCDGKDTNKKDDYLFEVSESSSFTIIGSGLIDMSKTSNYGYLFKSNGNTYIEPSSELIVKIGYHLSNSSSKTKVYGGKYCKGTSSYSMSSYIDSNNYDVLDENGYSVVKALNNICTVNGVAYKKISVAMNAAKVDNVITYPIILTADAVYSGNILEDYTFDGNKTLTINGKIKAGIYNCAVETNNGAIMGGSYNAEPNSNSIDSHYTAIKNVNMWNVVVDENNYAASINSAKYGSIEDAMKAAVSGDTIVLNGDSNETGLKTSSNISITLDINGYKLTGTGSVINQYSAGSITIKGNSNSAINGTIRMYGNDATITISNEFAGKIDGFDYNGGTLTISGGLLKSTIINTIFNDKIASGYFAENAVDGYRKVSKLTVSNALLSATIGSETTYYASLGKALEAVKAGGTITLLKDCDSSSGDYGFNYYATGDVSFDLNGHEWTLSSPNSSFLPAIRLYSGNLTVKSSKDGGKIYSNWSGCKIFDIRGGNLTIESGDFSGDGTITSICSDSTPDSDFNITINGGIFGTISCHNKCQTVTINGGTFNKGISTAYNSNTVVNITGGTFNEQVCCNQSNTGVFNISGGTFNSYVGNGGTFNISGGTFTNAIYEKGVYNIDPSNKINTKYCKATDNGNGTWTVESK